MSARMPFICLAKAALLAIHGSVAAETVYQWTDPHGRPQFSDSPPVGQDTVIRIIAGDGPSSPGRQGLREGERRMLDRLAQRAKLQRQARESRGRKAHQHRMQIQQSCRDMREQLRETRDNALRKHYARKLRRHCW
jgi:hypothetical protein